MGLDNGICIKRNDYSTKIKELKPYASSFDLENKYDFDICYWRKCWNVRNAIFNHLNLQEDNGTYALNLDEVRIILHILLKYNSHNWVYGGFEGSIWTWEEHKTLLKKHIKNLRKLIRLMKKYPELEVYFYDSY